MSELAIFGGKKAIEKIDEDVFKWPIITEEDEMAVVEVLKRRAMSGVDVTRKFEEEFAKWNGTKYALGFNNGTASLLAAMYGAGVGHGDEIIAPTITYWASCTQAFSLGATVVFANVDPDTLCIDPEDIKKKITPRTKAIVAVHYLAHPCDMDAIMAIAEEYGIKVIEDVSHAQGGLYKGRKLGSIGHVAGMSMMTGKSFAIGEAGMLVTNDTDIYERAVSLGSYERFNENEITNENLRPYVGLPFGGYKFRMHQMSSAVGRVQLKYYDERCAEIRNAMNYFWDLLDGVPGIRAMRVDECTGSNMAGFYAAHGKYVKEELGGLSITRFCEAVRAEGFEECVPGCNAPLHTHPLFSAVDVYGAGKPTRIANCADDIRRFDENLEASADLNSTIFWVPWFKKFDKALIEQCANAYKKVALNYKELLEGDEGDPERIGGWFFFKSAHKK